MKWKLQTAWLCILFFAARETSGSRESSLRQTSDSSVLLKTTIVEETRDGIDRAGAASQDYEHMIMARSVPSRKDGAIEADEGRSEVIKVFDYKEVDVADFNSRDQTPLHKAVLAEKIDDVKALLDAGADVDVRDRFESTPLHYAAWIGLPAIARVLLNAGADVNAVEVIGRTPLHYAAYMGHPRVAEILVEFFADIDATDIAKWTPLHVATETGHRGVVEVLINAGADLQSIDEDGWTALHLAASDGHPRITEDLINAGADVDAPDEKEWTPLHLGAASGNPRVVEVLLDNGASKTKVNSDGNTPFDVVCTDQLALCSKHAKSKLESLLSVDDY